MSHKKPGLIIFTSVILFMMSAIMIFGVFISARNEIFLSAFLIGLACLCLITGIGLLKRQKWSRASAGIICGLIFFTHLSSLSSFNLPNQQNLTTAQLLADLLGIMLGKFLGLVFPGIVFYAMLKNKTVDDYFKRS